VVSTLRLYYDAVIAVALMAVVVIACGIIAAVITGDSSPNFPVAAIALSSLLAHSYSYASGARRARLRFRSGDPGRLQPSAPTRPRLNGDVL
jgi:hypothetical protein